MVDEHLQDETDCKEAVERLYHFLDGELTDERRAMIQRHLDACSDCIEAFEFELELRTAIARGCQEAVPESLRVRVFRAIWEERSGPLPPTSV
jgi:mycothiol system anti-sigma-R factor